MRRRRKTPDSPEVTAAYEVIDAYVTAQEALAAAGDRFARDRIRLARFTRGDIRRYGLDFVSELNLRGYARETQRLTGSEDIPADLPE